MVNTGEESAHSFTNIYYIYLRSWGPDSSINSVAIQLCNLGQVISHVHFKLIIYRSFLLVFIPYNILRDCSFFAASEAWTILSQDNSTVMISFNGWVGFFLCSDKCGNSDSPWVKQMKEIPGTFSRDHSCLFLAFPTFLLRRITLARWLQCCLFHSSVCKYYRNWSRNSNGVAILLVH